MIQRHMVINYKYSSSYLHCMHPSQFKLFSSVTNTQLLRNKIFSKHSRDLRNQKVDVDITSMTQGRVDIDKGDIDTDTDDGARLTKKPFDAKSEEEGSQAVYREGGLA